MISQPVLPPQPNQPPHPDRSRLHRSRQERVLFGVCGGIADYLGVDPTVVRVAFVLAALIPPMSAFSILGYPLLAIIMPVAESATLPSRDRVRSNIEALRTDAGELAGQVRGALSSITRRPQPPANEAVPSNETAGTDGAAATILPESPDVVDASRSTRGPAQVP